jgi:F0F1-type ATP synthase assembly protein I
MMFNKILASSKIIQFFFGVFVGAFMGGLIGTIMRQQMFGITAGALMGMGLGIVFIALNKNQNLS